MPNGDHENTWISKHTASAPVQTMIATDAGHGAILGGLAHDKVLFDFNGKLVLAPWRPGNISRTSRGVKDWGGAFQSGNMSAVIDRRWGTACFYHHDKKTVVLRALADVETQTDRPLGKAGPLVNRSPAGRLTLRHGWAIYNRQLFYLIGDHAGGQELISLTSLRQGCCGDSLRSCAATWPGRSPKGCSCLTSGCCPVIR